jgi:hypothetical protein
MTRNISTHWDSCSILDSISPIGGFLAFVDRFHYWLLFKGSLSCYRKFSSLHASCLDGLPFPSADLKSPFCSLQRKNTHFCTYTCPISYTTSVYAGCSTTTHVHRVWCSKIKNYVGFPCHVMRSMILDLPYTGNALTQPFSSIWRL